MPIIALLAGALLTQPGQSVISPSLTVDAAIGMRRFVPLTTPEGRPATVLFSPDRTQFLALIRHGDAQSAETIYQLELYRTDDVRTCLRRASCVAPSRTLLRGIGEETPLDLAPIGGVRWSAGGSAVSLIVRAPGNITTVEIVDVARGRREVLLRSAAPLANYAITPDRRRVVYSEYVPPDWSYRRQPGFAITSESLASLATSQPGRWMLRYRIHDVATGQDRNAGVGLGWGLVPDIAISANGRRAALLTTIFERPSAWRSYRFPGSRNSGSADENEAFGRETGMMSRATIVDLSTGRAEQTLDSPVFAWSKAIWVDDRSVVIGPAFFPVGSHGASGDQSLGEQGLVRLDTTTGVVTILADLFRTPSTGRVNFSSVPAGWQILIQPLSPRRPEYVRRLVRDGDGWRVEEAALPQGTPEIAVDQSADRPPELAMRVGETAMRFTNVNATLASQPLGQVEAIRWRDSLGAEHLGGLLLPSGYEAGRRYPVIVQTYGFDPAEFLIDGAGGMTSGFAARPLASRGFVVLQLPDLPSAPPANGQGSDWSRTGEIPRFVAMLDGGLTTLEERGLIDTNRIGVSGFSHSGMQVLASLTRSRFPIAAAIVADAYQATPYCYAQFYGSANFDELEQPAMMGGPFWGPQIRTWIERSPAFHLDRINAAIRFEHHGTTSLPCTWDTFAIMKRMGRPVEMVVLPLAGHNIVGTASRRYSQQGAVDWFAFWLMGSEGNDAVDPSQYQRWRRLRERASQAAR